MQLDRLHPSPNQVNNLVSPDIKLLHGFKTVEGARGGSGVGAEFMEIKPITNVELG